MPILPEPVGCNLPGRHFTSARITRKTARQLGNLVGVRFAMLDSSWISPVLVLSAAVLVLGKRRDKLV